MLWHAMPPELNTARLMAGAGQAPMLTAAVGWEALAAALDAQATELAARLSSLGEAWTGGSSEKAITAAKPMAIWLQTASTQAKTRAAQATAQAAAYTQAMTTTPSLPEIAANHITTAVLTATNFLGINTVPIAFSEGDYFVRMWNQAALAMDIYQGATTANTLFDEVEPMASILDPATSSNMAPAQLMGTAATKVVTGETPQKLERLAGLDDPLKQVSQPIQQLTSLFSQLSSTGSSGGELGGGESAQLGLLGASPLSNHPLAGGSGPGSGAGLLRSETLPGAGGTLARTPLMAELIDKPATPAMLPAAAESSATGGAAPVGGAVGQAAQSAGSARPGAPAPVSLVSERDKQEENDDERWDNEEDW